MDRRITLSVPPETAAVGVATAAVEQAALLFGLDQGRALRLTLAVEELFTHVLDGMGSAAPGRRVGVEAIRRAAGVEVQLEFEAQSLDLGALNLTDRGQGQAFLEQGEFGKVGLMLAASSVDRLRLERVEGGGMRIILEQDREYPEPCPEARPEFAASGPVRVERAPAPELLKEACLLALARCPAEDLPHALRAPGRLVDLAAGGEMRALVALDSRGRVCGLLIWSRGDAKTIAFRGPWVFSAEPFGQGEAAARALLEELIREVGRSGASGIVTCQAAAHVHAGTGGFERLGSLAYDLPVGRRLARDTFFRLLAEDLGEVVWGHPSIEPFLRSEYERLDLARDIRSAISLGEAEPERSVFSARIEARLAEAELRPLLPGRDAHDNIAGHVRALRADGLVNILFVLDLAHAWQAALAGPLTDNGFKPRMIVPLAGRSDLVVFQHDHAVDR